MLMPLCFVVIVNGLKDFCEDFKRKQSDNRENYSNCISLSDDKKSKNKNNKKNFIFRDTLWMDLTPGQIVKINKDENFPADLLLIYSSNKNGSAYTETKNLDGETNLKFKEAIKNISVHLKKIKTEDKLVNEIKLLKGVVNCDDPNPYLYDFSGVLKIKNNLFQEKTNNKNSFLISRENTVNEGDYFKEVNKIFRNILNSGNKYLKNFY